MISPGYQAVVIVRVAAQHNSRGCHLHDDMLYLSDIACVALCSRAVCNLHSRKQWLRLISFISLACVLMVEQVYPCPTHNIHIVQSVTTGGSRKQRVQRVGCVTPCGPDRWEEHRSVGSWSRQTCKQAALGNSRVQGDESHHLGRSPGGKKRQDLFLEGQEYWEGYQAGDLNTKE